MPGKNIEDAYPLSPMQQGMLFHSLYTPASGVYVEQMSLELRGRLNQTAFMQAWQQAIAQHPVLRSAFVWEKLEQPLQVVGRQVKLPWEEQDWRGISPKEQQIRLRNLLQADRQRGFELSKAPLMRLILLRLNADTYHFTWSYHHLLLDGWSVQTIFQEVTAVYKACCQGQNLTLAKPSPYRDYIAWLQQQDLSGAEDFWRQQLKGFMTPTSLGVNRVSQLPDQNPDCDEQELQLSIATTAALKSLAKQQHLTLNTLVQGAWALLLSHYSGEEDVLFGTTVSGRPSALERVESMVGLFINTLPVRVRVSPAEFLLPWLQQIQTQQTEIRQYEYSPLVEIHGWSEVPRDRPLFDSLVIFENYPVESSWQEQVADLEIARGRLWEKTSYPLTLMAVPGAGLVLKILSDCHQFEAATITRMLGHLQTLLESMAASPHQQLALLSPLTATERQQLLIEWNNTQTDNSPGLCWHQLFEAQVKHSPDAIAVIYEDKHLTYQELDRQANQLARYLQTLGVEPEVLVGICVERSLEMVIGLLGILKAGGAYVPLDPVYPQERLAFMLEDAKVPVLLTQAKCVAALSPHVGRVVCLDTDWEKIAQTSDRHPSQQVTPANLAYVIYTSGSTGKPKGVEIPHSALMNFLSAIRLAPGLTEKDTLLAVTTLSFDIAGLELYLPLMVGACLVIVSQEVARDGTQLLNRLVSSEATVMQATPATWRLLLASGWQGSDRLKIFCGGEALERELAHQLLAKGAELWNLYGPTETTIWSAVCKVETQIENNIVSIGRPIANTQFYVLDTNLQPAPLGIVGELHIGGAGLARGYRHRAELTAEKFIPNPFDNTPVSRLYKTGDLVRYRADGNLEYLGRIDSQVKVRGFRIELGEIEAVLNQYPGVRETVVVTREDEPGAQRLVAYVVLQPGQTLTITVRRFLASKLPNYMVPAAFTVLEALPLTPNGKIDRRSLPAPEPTQLQPTATFAPASTPVAEMLAGIWSQVLGSETVGLHDNFFELGGHSLLATRVLSQIRQVFQIEMPLSSLFELPTIAGLAKEIETATKSGLGLEVTPIPRVPREKKLSLSFAQQRLWFLDQIQPGHPAYNIPIAVCLVGTLNVAALEQSCNEIVKRHEALRTSFIAIDGEPVQAIAPTLTLSLPIVDLSELPLAKREAVVQQLAKAEAVQPFNLAQCPLLRIVCLRLAEAEHVVLLTMHHIVSDAWSIGVLVQEVATLYTAFCTGKPFLLPELNIQYADFTVWQRQWLQGEALQTQLNYWKQQLGSAFPQLALPRSDVPTSKGAKHAFVVPPVLTQAIALLCRQEGVTLFMILLAAFQATLYCYTGTADIRVGSPIANRNRAEIEGLIGFFVNTLVLRIDLSDCPSFRELLVRSRQVTLAAYAHQDLPFEKLVEELQPERRLDRHPLYQAWFVLQNTPIPPLELPGLTLSLLEIDSGMVRHDLLLAVWESPTDLKLTFEYKTDLFDKAAIARLERYFVTLLHHVVAQPNIKLNKLAEILAQSDKQQQLLQQSELKASEQQKLKLIKRKLIRN